MNKIVLLSDDDTSVFGRIFFAKLSEILSQKGMQVYEIHLSVRENLVEALRAFDRISLEIKPDLMFVADFACIRMQSTEEEPMYNHMPLPIVHLLFRRPWEYEIFLKCRCSFHTRFYCILQEDAMYIRQYYDKLLNVACLNEAMWSGKEKDICYFDKDCSILREKMEQSPAYIRTLDEHWKNTMCQNPGMTDIDGLRMCLQKIGFTYEESELPSILYMLKDVFPLYYLEKQKIGTCCLPEIELGAMEQQVEVFLDMNFKVSLL